jgi:hypothetical protein
MTSSTLGDCVKKCPTRAKIVEAFAQYLYNTQGCHTIETARVDAARVYDCAAGDMVEADKYLVYMKFSKMSVKSAHDIN